MFRFLLCGICFLSITTSYASATTVTGNSGYTSNCIPFGNGDPNSYGNYKGFVYQNVPAFTLAVGDTIAFDLGAQNDNDIVMNIAFAATLSNGSDQEDSNGFTQVVSAGTPSEPRGNNTTGDYELKYTADAPFTFGGGGLIIRFNGAGMFASDGTCDQVLHGFDSSDSSGFFVTRFYNDSDGSYPWSGMDGSSIGGFVIGSVDFDGDGYTAADDCNDNDASIYPGAPEYCDGVDTDCDNVLDEDDALDAVTWYSDYDSDGYGDPSNTNTTCYIASGWVADSSDCDDTNSNAYPSAPEYCDGVDTDCDTVLDEDDALDTSTWYSDYDSDGYGDPNNTNTTCYVASGWVADSSDCDDTNSNAYPGATEVWYDGVDQDCDAWSDYDQDGDGFDSANDPDLDGNVGDDCDDEDFDINIYATEIWYDGVDQDCDAWSDYDQDGDGFDSENYNGDDCDDADEEVYPGAPDEPYDDIITDCYNASDYDADGDGFDSIDYGGDDCDDANSEINIDMAEIWYDGVDQDCDGNDDDQDEDGFPADEDCDDLDPDSYPDNGILDSECVEIDLGDTGDTGTDEDLKGCSCSGTGRGIGSIWVLGLAGIMLHRRRKRL